MYPGDCTLFLCGDVMTGRGIDQILPHSCSPSIREPFVSSALRYLELAEDAHGEIPRAVDYDYVWGEALAALAEHKPSVKIVNLETSITTSEDAQPKGINYRMHPGNVPLLTAAGVDCCVLANNHVLDYGIAGLVETIDSLQRRGITTTGAGRNTSKAMTPAVINLAGGGRVLVFAFGAPDCGIPPHWAARPETPGINLLGDLGERSVLRVAELVTSIKLPNDLAILSIHWGGNWGSDIPLPHRRFAHAVIDNAKIDLLHGHSSHHPKAVEIYHGHPIFYGCGDFLDDYEGITGYERYRGDLVLMYFPRMDLRTGELKELLLTPLQIRQFRLQRPSAADRAWLRTALETQCRRFGHCIADRDGAWVLR